MIPNEVIEVIRQKVEEAYDAGTLDLSARMTIDAILDEVEDNTHAPFLGSDS